MQYNPAFASNTRAEFEDLLAIYRGLNDPPPPQSADDEWRRAYQEEQRRRRIAGYQADLFSTTMTTHYHRNNAAPSWPRPPIETVEQKVRRIKNDPCATFGPPRSDRPAILSTAEKTAIARRASNWLRVRQRVRLVDAPGTVDPAFGVQRYLGRLGVIWRLCGSPFIDHCYVFFDPVGSERAAKIQMVEIRDLVPLS